MDFVAALLVLLGAVLYAGLLALYAARVGDVEQRMANLEAQWLAFLEQQRQKETH